jgi:N-formylglutamate amidohydrolase
VHKSTVQQSGIPGIYDLIIPDSALPLVFDSPHSGRIYPDDFRYNCRYSVLRRSEDRYVDRLFDHVPDDGAVFLAALFPCSYIDPNRAEDDIDGEILSAPWPDTINPTSRADAGIGIVRRLVTPGIPIYTRKLSPAEIKSRIERFYRPYHSALQVQLNKAHEKFGQVWHINCHSMPSRARARGRRYTDRNGKLADFVIGDRDGTSCEAEFTCAAAAFLQDMGYRVAINAPYKGVELIRRYAAPAEGRHSLQLEVNRALYLDEVSGELTPGFGRLKEDLKRFSAFMADYACAGLGQIAAD